MVGKETILICTDNSGVAYARCVNTSSSVNLHCFNLGSVITVFPKILIPGKPFKKKKYLGLVVSLKKITRRPQGLWLRFGSNKILLFNQVFKFLGTRVYGPICREVRLSSNKASYRKIISYSRLSI